MVMLQRLQSIVSAFFLLSCAAIFGVLNGEELDCSADNNRIKSKEEVEINVKNMIEPGHNGLVQIDFKSGYFNGHISTTAWCVDLDRGIKIKKYKVDVYSSLDPLAFPHTDAVDKPDMFPALNWLINNLNTGKMITIPNCVVNHTITDQEFQLATWKVIDNHEDPYSQWQSETEIKTCIVDHLYNQAIANKNYTIDCHDLDTKFAILLVNDKHRNGADTITNQVLIAEVSATHVCVCVGKLNGVSGDPHMKTWAGESYDFHGVCDLVLLSNPGFQNGLGMNIHIRTKKMRLWSYVHSAAIRIGNDIFDVMGSRTGYNLWINGAFTSPDEIKQPIDDSESEIINFEYPIRHRQVSNKSHEFVIDLTRDEGESIIFTTWNSFVKVSIRNPTFENFGMSVGLMGTFPKGIRLSRDNVSIIENTNTFGLEWQVLSSEPKLFRTIEGPQKPSKCEIPTRSEMRRHLIESEVSFQNAQTACSRVKSEDIDLCVFDVMATGDKFTADAY